jgi:DNA-binding PadR family transcriptional regulator
MSWARMLDMPQTTASETTISRNWSWLEQQKLIRTERDHRVRKVTLLMEDGSGDEFERATGKDRGFFKLPYAYFTERIHQDLNLAGKATLLICLAQKPAFTLPTERASTWYGVSPDTLQRGLDQLREQELIKVWTRTKKAPRARYGFTTENHYALQGPFARAPIEPELTIESVARSSEDDNNEISIQVRAMTTP